MTELAGPIVGDIVAGKYRLERVLGSGGMGIVFAATHLLLQQTVAIKFLTRSRPLDGLPVARFLHEARAASKIRSEHVALVLDVGLLDTGEPYMVLEYLEGQDLAQRLFTHATLPVVEAVGYVVEALEGLAHAHALGIVHRDLKPANLFLARSQGRPSVKVLDFGVSKSAPATGLDAAPGGLTAPEALLGTPSYMSPEQARSSRDVDARTDIWAMGVVLHELLTGRVPFDAPTVGGVLAAIAADDPPLVHELRSDVPRELAAVVTRCLQRRREDRFADVAELAAALAPFAPAHASTTIRVRRLVDRAKAAPADRAMETMDAVADTERPSTPSAMETLPLRAVVTDAPLPAPASPAVSGRAALASSPVRAPLRLTRAAGLAVAVVAITGAALLLRPARLAFPVTASVSGAGSVPGSGSGSVPGSVSGSVSVPAPVTVPAAVPVAVPDAGPPKRPSAPRPPSPRPPPESPRPVRD